MAAKGKGHFCVAMKSEGRACTNLRVESPCEGTISPQGSAIQQRATSRAWSSWSAALVSMVSFALWVYGTDGYFLLVELPASPPGLISVAIGVWTFLIPLIYKGD